MHRPLALLIAVVAVVTACNAVLGLEERPERASAVSTAASGGGGGVACAACERDVPAGWSGPTAVRTADEPLGCDQPERPNVELSLFDELVAPAALCECACEDAVGVNCDAAPVQVTTYFNDNCTNPDESGSGVVGQCISLCCSARSARYVKATPDTSGASCAPVVVSDAVPPVGWDRHLMGCGPVAASSCGGERCFDEPAGHALCIYRSGEHPCPAGPFSGRSVWYADHADERGCEPCACGPVDTADCNEQVVGYAIVDCTLGGTPIPADPSCMEPNLDFDSARVESVSPTGSCTPTGGAPTGAAIPAEATTVCCSS